RFRPAVIGRDQRYRQDGRIEQRTPGEDFGDAENRDRAPRTDDEVAGCWHGWVRRKPSLEQDQSRRNPFFSPSPGFLPASLQGSLLQAFAAKLAKMSSPACGGGGQP